MKLLSELKRRKVYYLSLYLAGAWPFVQIAESVAKSFWCVPDSASRYIWIAVTLAFPIAAVFSWKYELSFRGIHKTLPRGTTNRSVALAKADFGLLIALSMLMVAIASWMLVELYEKRNCDPPPPGEDEFGLAILPPHSAGTQFDVVAVGVFNELHSQAARIDRVHLIPRYTIQVLVDKGMTAASIVDETRARYVLDTSVNVNGPTVTINSQLFAGRSGDIAWTDTLTADNTPEQIQQGVNKIIEATAQAMGLSMPNRPVSPQYTPDPVAWRNYHLGRQKLDLGTTRAIEQAIANLEKAIGIEPDYAEALTSLAVAYREFKFRTGRWYSVDSEKNSINYVERAQKLNPYLGEAVAAYALWLMNDTRANRQTEFERAIALDPQSAFVYEAYGQFQFGSGNLNAALQIFQKGIQKNPQSASLYTWVGIVQKRLEAIAESEVNFDIALEFDPEFIMAYEHLAVLLWNHTNRLVEVMTILRKAYDLDPKHIEIVNLVAWIYLDLGDDQEAERWARHAVSLADSDCRYLDAMADILHWRGKHERELEYLNLDTCGIKTMGSTEVRLARHYTCDGRYTEAMVILRNWQPILFKPDTPIADFLVSAYNMVAYIYSQTGQSVQANDIWHRLQAFSDTQRADLGLNQLMLAEILSAQQIPDQALGALERANSLGWRWMWRFFLDDCLFDSIRDDPRFQAVVAEIEADMQQQLEHVRELERSGQLAMLRESLR